MFLYSGYLGILRVIFPLLIVLISREGSHWSTGYLSIHSGLWTSLNSMGVRKCKGHLQVIRGLAYSHSSQPHWSRIYLRPPPLYGVFYLALVSARLGLLFSEDTYHHLVSWFRWFDYSGWKNTCPAVRDDNILSPSYLQKWYRRKKSKRVHNPTWCAGSLKVLGATYEGSNVLSVFLLNTNLHAF